MVNGTLKHRMRMAVTRIGAISVFVLIALWAPATRAALSVGVSSQVINYDSCGVIETVGGNIDKVSPTGMDDPRFQLTANAIAASDGTTTVLLLTLDILMMKATHGEAWEASGPGLYQIAVNLSSYAGIPVANILINATHTHHAPSTAMIHDYARNTCFCDAVIAAATAAGKMAFDSRVPANLFYGRVVNFALGQNSRALSSNGWVRFTDQPSEPWFDSSGPYDPDFTVLQFRDVNAPQRPLATLFTHNVHNSGNLNGDTAKISPDLFGVAAQELTALPGNGVNLFFSGASGSSHSFYGPTGSAYTGIIEQLVTDAAQTATLVPNPTIDVRRQLFTYSIRNFTEETESALLNEYLNHFPNYPSDWLRIFADQRSKLLTLTPGVTTRTTIVQAIRLGDVFIVGLPGEVFAQIGLSIKTLSPAPRTIVLGLSNDYVGYLPN
jgi:neutral ceramidase